MKHDTNKRCDPVMVRVSPVMYLYTSYLLTDNGKQKRRD